MLSVVVGVACLAFRYWRGTEVVRRQLLWLVGAAAVILLAVIPWALVAGTPIAVLFTIPLLPAAVAVAVLRHQLLDIRLVIARGLTFALLSGLVLAAYAALVIVLSGVASALLVALLALPLRSRLQAAVDRLFYGERGNPLTVASRVGRSMQGGLADTLAELGEALRLPYVGVHVDDVVLASGGELSGPSASMPLDGATLVVGLRSGEKRLAPADQRVLALLSGPLSTAVRATSLLEDLQLSRERLVVAREEERRRLRRELHDGLGPLLTGVALSADAASNLAGPSSERPAGATHLGSEGQPVRDPRGTPDRGQPRVAGARRARPAAGATPPGRPDDAAVRRLGAHSGRGGGARAASAAGRCGARCLPDCDGGPHQRRTPLRRIDGRRTCRLRRRPALRGARQRDRLRPMAAGSRHRRYAGARRRAGRDL